MKRILITILLLSTFVGVENVFAKSTTTKSITVETGIYYNNVRINQKKVYINNPVSLVYRKTTDRVIFEEIISKQRKTSGYWISKINEPDKIILDKKQIAALNNNIYDLHLGIYRLDKYSQTV